MFVENIRRVISHFRPHYDEHGHERIYAKPYYELGDGTLRLYHVPPRRDPYDEHELSAMQGAAVDHGGRYLALRKMATALRVRNMVQKLTRYQPLPQYQSSTDPAWQLMRAILGQWIRALVKPVVLMPLPLPQHLDQTCDASGYVARFTHLSRELGCYLHDPLPDLLDIAPAERRKLRWEKDIHFTPAGHAALARALAPTVHRILARTRAAAPAQGD